MEKLILVSTDSHMTPPPEAWPEYLDPKYHDLLPELHAEDETYKKICGYGYPSAEDLQVISPDGSYEAGAQGVWNLDTRLAEMDREGVAAEMVHFGDARAISIFCGATNNKRDPEVNDAGVHATNRWAYDTFGSAQDRLLMVAQAGPGVDMDVTVAELQWAADHGYVGTFLPSATTGFGVPPLYDEHFEPFWRACEDLGMLVVCHAGFGPEQGEFVKMVAGMVERMQEAGGTDLLKEIFEPKEKEEAMARAARMDQAQRRNLWGFRRPLWQITLGGVFDRHPDLRLFMTEVRADWLPETLRQIDEMYAADAKIGDVGAKRPPSEYWGTNCFVGLSFIHEAEVAMRNEIGVETIMFGRDYPHPEGMWPNTTEWLKHAFADVPEDEMRLMLGENAIRIMGLDRARLAEVADRIGPTFADLAGQRDTVDPRLIQAFNTKSGYLAPREEIDTDSLSFVVGEDLAGIGAGSST